MRIAFAVLAAALLSSPALAADEPVATASQTPAPAAITTADQIDAYLKSSPALDAKADGAMDGVVARDRKVHGEVSVGIGTGGYRSVYLRSDVPVGDNGRLSLAFEDTKYGRNAPYRFHGGAYGGHPGALGVVDRQRCDLEGLTAPRPLDVTGGPHGRCVGRLPGW